MIQEKKDLVIIDVRTNEEFKGGSLERAINIPYDQLENRLHELEINREVLVFCKSGGRSLIASELLAKKGFTVYNMYDGYQGYINQ